jgi:hypothetical protein
MCAWPLALNLPFEAEWMVHDPVPGDLDPARRRVIDDRATRGVVALMFRGSNQGQRAKELAKRIFQMLETNIFRSLASIVNFQKSRGLLQSYSTTINLLDWTYPFFDFGVEVRNDVTGIVPIHTSYM